MKNIAPLSIIALILLGLAGGFFYLEKRDIPLPEPAPTPPPSPVIEEPPAVDKDALRKEFMALMEQANKKQEANLLDLPSSPPPEPELEPLPPIEEPPVILDDRAKGRKEREGLPLGVILIDGADVLPSKDSAIALYKMKTGDFVRVFEKESDANWLKVQPGVDLYLAKTSKKFEAAGNRFPDVAGWVLRSQIHIFKPDQAIEFTQETTPMTLGPDSTFSTLAFYERALKNPDPVVHRVIGPRFIELLSVHEDYASSWGALYRDGDSQIRSFTLAALRKRGVGHDRGIIEDLIKRLSELTQRKATGEQEAEVLSILAILEGSGHPRTQTALQSFAETWELSQGKAVMSRVRDILSQTTPTP